MRGEGWVEEGRIGGGRKIGAGKGREVDGGGGWTGSYGVLFA